MTARRSLVAGFALALAAGTLSPLAAQSALGGSGEIYRIRRGTYAELLPAGSGGDPTNVVLALEITSQSGAVKRTVVPGTEGPEVEDAPAFAFDRATNTAYVAFASRRSPLVSSLHIVGYRDGEWGHPVDFSGDAFSTKSRPRLVVTSATVSRLDESGVERLEKRTLFHLVWWDDAGDGGKPVYAPLLVQPDGTATAQGLITLSDLLPPAEPSGATVPTGLATAPILRAGLGPESVVAAFADPVSGRMATLELRYLSASFVALADEGARVVADLAASEPDLSPAELADRARAQIIVIGRRFLQDEVAGLVARSVADAVASVAASEPDRPSSLADRARAQIIVIGRSVSDPVRRADGGTDRILELGAGSSDPLMLAAAPVASVGLPSLPDRAFQTFTSADGSALVVAWDAGTAVRYRELLADGSWSEIRGLATGAEMTREQAYELLQLRLESR